MNTEVDSGTIDSGSVESGSVDSERTVTSIAVSPSTAYVLNNNTQQFAAMASYDDGSLADVSDSATWEVVGDPTVANVSSSGLLTSTALGSIQVTATKGGIVSNAADVTVCDLSGPCIDIYDVGSGKLYTNSPSKPYVDRVGGITTDGVQTENGIRGLAGDYYEFSWANANALCNAYSANNLGGRTNWRLATRSELKTELYNVLGDMFTAREWPTRTFYWSSTANLAKYYIVSMSSGLDVFYIAPSEEAYVSCVSTP
ncbi:DUF1566 domain-containing protein [Vibrio coralliilyticus]|uniref:Lcl domain-containing protein n=1 Tax=Vibrio coralliilyticus TaxID=190893 RepID=UPI0015D4B7B8|nr:DUF1566 domain-containing protein [Vibrio coralliilyticus]